MALPELNLPSWLNAGEPAGAPMLRGAQAGGIIANNFMQARAMKERAAAQKQDFALRERELTSRNSAMAIEAQLHAQKLATAQLQAVDMVATRERSLTAQGMLSEAGNLVGKAVIAPLDNPAAREAVYDVFARYPGLATIPQGKELWDTFQASEANAGDMQRQIAVAKARGPLGGSDATSAMKNSAYLTTLRRDAEALRAAGNTAGYQAKQAEIASMEEQVQKGQTFRAYGPGGEVTAELISGGGGGGATMATQTAGQKRLTGYELTVEGIQDVTSKLRTDDVGVRGVIGENIFDTWVEQLVPGTRSTERIENRAALRMLSEQVIEGVSADTSGRFSDADVRRLREISGSIGASKSVGEIKDRLGEVQRIIRDRARTYAERTSQPIPDFAKSDPEIVGEYETQKTAIQKAVDENRITLEQGEVELKAAYTKASSARRRFHGVGAP